MVVLIEEKIFHNYSTQHRRAAEVVAQNFPCPIRLTFETTGQTNFSRHTTFLIMKTHFFQADNECFGQICYF